jgi:hypothetical protein
VRLGRACTGTGLDSRSLFERISMCEVETKKPAIEKSRLFLPFDLGTAALLLRLNADVRFT